MKKIGFIILIFALSFGFIYAENAAINGAELGKWTMDLDAAQKLAKQKQLPLLLNYTGSDWCGWCKLMDRQVFSKPEWSKYAKTKLVMVMFDFPSNKSLVPTKYVQRNRNWARKYGVRGYPTYILLDSDGKTELGRLGAGRGKTPKVFIQEVENITRLRKAAIAKIMKKLSKKDGKKYKALLQELENNKKALNAWLQTRPQRTEANIKKYQGFQAKETEINRKLTALQNK